MKISLYTIVAFSVLALGAHIAVCGGLPVKKPTTVLVYMAADNNLAPEARKDIEEMQKIGSTRNLSILVHLNTRLSTGKKITRKLYITKGSAIQIGPDESRDSGIAPTLLEACTWALTSYPSDQFALILWNHGAGPLNRNDSMHELSVHDQEWTQGLFGQRGVCYDDSTGHYLNDIALSNVLDIVVNKYRKGQKLDIIAFDACLMAGIEIAHLVAPYANYLVASQQTIPGSGYNYTTLLDPVSKRIVPSKDFATWFVRSYDLEYANKVNDYTLSTIDTTRALAIVNYTNALAALLIKGLQGNDAKNVRMAIQKAAQQTVYFEEPTYLDLAHLYRNLSSVITPLPFSDNLLKNQILTTIVMNLNAISQAVLASVAGPYYRGNSGISIYFPESGSVEPSYLNLLWAQKNSWPTLLTTLYPAS